MPNGEDLYEDWRDLPLPGTLGAAGARPGQWTPLQTAPWDEKGAFPAELPWWDLPSEEVEAKYFDLSIEPYPAPEGYHWEQSEYDENQMPARPHWVLVPDEMPEGMGYDELSPLEKAQIERWNRELELAEQRFAWEKRQQPTGMTEFQQAQMGLQWAQLLAQYGGAGDWITQWQLQHLPRGTEPEWDYAGSREEARKKGLRKWYPTDLRDYGGRYISRQETIAGLSTEEAIQKAHAGIAAKKSAREFSFGRPLTPEEEERAEVEWFQAQMPPRKIIGAEKEPTTPPAPEWLPQYVPGLKAGEPITARPIKIPSGQQWAAMPWSVEEGLKGYAEWAGQPWADIRRQSARMQPKTPRGAGVERWRPSIQRA